MEINLKKYCKILKTTFIIVLILGFQSSFIACTSKVKKDSGQKEVTSKPGKQENSGKALEPDLFFDAALNGDLEGIRSMLKLGMDVNIAEEEGRTALMFAAYNGHTKIVKLLIERGAGVDTRDQADRTALLYAATGPFPETVKVLLEKKANPNAVDNGEHFSPLMHAAAEGNLDVVKILLEFGADPALKDIDEDTAESFARQKGHTKVVDYLKSLK
jgi:ankyrin repeat protein